MQQNRASLFSEIERVLIFDALEYYKERIVVFNGGTKNFSSEIHELLYEKLSKEFCYNLIKGETE